MALSSAPSPECVAAVHAWSAANRPGFFVGRGNGLKKLTGSLGRIDASIDSREVPAIVDIGAGMYYPKGRRDEYVKAGPRTDGPDESDSLVLLRDLGARATITAFEPRPDKALELLEAAVSRPGTRNNSIQLTVHPAAVGRSKGALAWANCHTGDTGWQLVGERSAAQLKHEGCTLEYTVPTTTLDAWATHALVGRSLFYLKVDVEGGEIAVLDGMSKLLAAQRVELMSFEYARTVGTRCSTSAVSRRSSSRMRMRMRLARPRSGVLCNGWTQTATLFVSSRDLVVCV